MLLEKIISRYTVAEQKIIREHSPLTGTPNFFSHTVNHKLGNKVLPELNEVIEKDCMLNSIHYETLFKTQHPRR